MSKEATTIGDGLRWLGRGMTSSALFVCSAYLFSRGDHTTAAVWFLILGVIA